jgi:hypothetical protein
LSIHDKYGRPIAVPARLTHKHSCGHLDACYHLPSDAVNRPCRTCKLDAFNREARERFEDELSTASLIERRA